MHSALCRPRPHASRAACAVYRAVWLMRCSYRDVRVGMDCVGGVLRCSATDTPLSRTLLQVGASKHS